MRGKILLSITLFLAACDPHRDSKTGASVDQPQTPSAPATEGFLGVADDKPKKIGDDSPDSALADMVSITQVRSSTPEAYEQARAEGSIKSQEMRNGYMYYAVEQTRHRPFPNGASAGFTVIERSKTKPPPGR